jgi:hypothetical protein
MDFLLPQLEKFPFKDKGLEREFRVNRITKKPAGFFLKENKLD